MFYIKFRVPIISVLLLITMFLGFGLSKIEKENGIEALIPKENSDYMFFKDMEEEFGATDQIVIGLTFTDTVYSKKNLNVVRDLSLYLQEDPYIEEDDVTSLTLIDNIDGIDGELIVEPLVPEHEDITREIANTAALKVRDSDMLRDKIVSNDEKSTVIIVTVNTDVSLNAEVLEGLIDRVSKKLNNLEKENPHIKSYRSGMVSVKHITSEYMSRDLSLMFPIAIIVVLVLLLIILKSISGVLIPLLVTLFSIIWTLGLKGWLGSPLTITETVIPIMLIAIGCADGVHIVSEFLTLTRSGVKKKNAIIKTMRHLRTPVVLTSITTSLGFFSLIVAPGVSIKNMGLFLGFGVLTAMLFSLLFIPGLLSFKKDKKVLKESVSNRVKDISFLGQKVIKGRYAIIFVSIILLAISIIGMINIKIETDQIMFLKDSDPLKISTKSIQNNLGGINTLDIVFQGEESSFKDPEVLHFIEDLQNFSNEKEIVGYTISITDYIKKIYYEFNNKNPKYNRLPNIVEIVDMEEVSGRDTVSNLLFIYEMGGGEIDKVVNSDYSITKVSLRLLETSQLDMTSLIEQLDSYINSNIPDGITYRYSNDYMRVVMGDLITRSQIRSFVSTLLAIVILLMIIFKSPISGFLTALPVIIAVCLNFGIMWLTGTTLNIGTSIIASVGMGVGIDYAIHFFQRYKQIYRESEDNYKSIILAINQCFKPVLTNALAVGIGFLTLLFSNYYIIAGIGWITGISMLTTAICALFVLPAYLAVFNPLKKRGDITMKKGLIALFLIATTSLFADSKADEIMLKNSLLKESENSFNTTTMVLINKKGKKKVRKMHTYTRETEIGEDKYIDFLLPKDVSGTKFLTIGKDNSDDDQRIYLPALKKVRKISSSNKNGKFMGSDITYYDMESRAYSEYSYKFIKDIILEGIEYWVVESISKDLKAPYNRVLNYVGKDDYFIYKKEMFNKKDMLIKTIAVVEIEIVDGIIIPSKTVVDNHKDRHKTLLIVEEVVINSQIDNKLFTIQNLK